VSGGGDGGEHGVGGLKGLKFSTAGEEEHGTAAVAHGGGIAFAFASRAGSRQSQG